MVRATKTTSTPVTAAPVVAEKKATKKTEKKVAAPVEAAPAVANVVLAEGEVASDVSSLTTKFSDVSARLQQAFSLISSLKSEMKTLEKAVSKEMKIAQKASSKRKRTSGNRAPSGFVKPTLISDELAAFLGKDKGTELARTAVSKEINAYIRENKLQDPANGRKINPDAKLAKLLKMGKEDQLTYFNLQRYMKHHFPKPVVAVVV